MLPFPLVTRSNTGDFNRTSSRKVEFAEAMPSLTFTVIYEKPSTPGTGLMVRNRLLPVPLKAMPELATTLVFDDTAETVRLEAGVSESPTVNGIGAVAVP